MKRQVVSEREQRLPIVVLERQWKPVLLGFSYVIALALLIFALDYLAGPSDVSPGAALAAAAPSAQVGAREVSVVRREARAADASANDTLPDAIR